MSANITAASTSCRRHRLQRHLGAQLGGVGDLEERVSLADGAILGKRAARLAHEPHRRPLDVLAPGGADEKRVVHLTRVAPIVQRAGEHPVTAGPLAPRWLAWSLEPARAGASRSLRASRSRTRGTATWRTHGAGGVQASYHWLDPLGNPIVWDGTRTRAAARRRARGDGGARARGHRTAPAGPLPARVRPRRGASFLVRRGRRRCRSSVDVEVAPRIADARLEVRVHGGSDPATIGRARGAGGAGRRAERCSRRAPRRRSRAAAGVVAPAARRPRGGLGGGRDRGRRAGPSRSSRPRARPVARGRPQSRASTNRCFSPRCSPVSSASTHLGLPAYTGDEGLFDGRVAVTLPRRSGRRPS